MATDVDGNTDNSAVIITAINDRDSGNVNEVQHYDWCNLTSYAISDKWNDGVLKSRN